MEDVQHVRDEAGRSRGRGASRKLGVRAHDPLLKDLMEDDEVVLVATLCGDGRLAIDVGGHALLQSDRGDVHRCQKPNAHVSVRAMGHASPAWNPRNMERRLEPCEPRNRSNESVEKKHLCQDYGPNAPTPK